MPLEAIQLYEENKTDYKYIIPMKSHGQKNNYILSFHTNKLHVYSYAASPLFISSLSIPEYDSIEFMGYDEEEEALPIIFYKNNNVSLYLLTDSNLVFKITEVTEFIDPKDRTDASTKPMPSLLISSNRIATCIFKSKLTIIEYLKESESISVFKINVGFAFPICMFRTSNNNIIGFIFANYVSRPCYTIVCTTNKAIKDVQYRFKDEEQFDQDKMNGYSIFFTNINTKKASNYITNATNMKDYYINFRVYNDKIVKVVSFDSNSKNNNSKAEEIELLLIGKKNIYKLNINEVYSYNKQTYANEKVKISKREMTIIRNTDFQKIKEISSNPNPSLVDLKTSTVSPRIGSSICTVSLKHSDKNIHTYTGFVLITKTGLIHFLDTTNSPMVITVFDLGIKRSVIKKADVIYEDRENEVICIAVKVAGGNDLIVHIDCKDTNILKKESFKISEIETLQNIHKIEYIKKLNKCVICKGNKIYSLETVIGTQKDKENVSLLDNIIAWKPLKKTITFKIGKETNKITNKHEETVAKVQKKNKKTKVNRDESSKFIRHKSKNSRIELKRTKNRVYLSLKPVNQNTSNTRDSTAGSAPNNQHTPAIKTETQEFTVLIENSKSRSLFISPISIFLKESHIYLIDENNFIYFGLIPKKDSEINFRILNEAFDDNYGKRISHDKPVQAKFMSFSSKDENQQYIILAQLFNKKIQISLIQNKEIITTNTLFESPYDIKQITKNTEFRLVCCLNNKILLEVGNKHYNICIKTSPSMKKIKFYILATNPSLESVSLTENKNDKEIEYRWKFKKLVTFIPTITKNGPTVCYCKHLSHMYLFDTHLKYIFFENQAQRFPGFLKAKSKIKQKIENFGWNGIPPSYDKITFLKCFLEKNTHLIIGGCIETDEVGEFMDKSIVFILVERFDDSSSSKMKERTATIIKMSGIPNDALLLPNNNVLVAVGNTVRQYVMEDDSFTLKNTKSFMHLCLKLLLYNSKIIAIEALRKATVYNIDEKNNLEKGFAIRIGGVIGDVIKTKNILYTSTMKSKEVSIVKFGGFYTFKEDTIGFTVRNFVKKNNKIYGIDKDGIMIRILFILNE